MGCGASTPAAGASPVQPGAPDTHAATVAKSAPPGESLTKADEPKHDLPVEEEAGEAESTAGPDGPTEEPQAEPEPEPAPQEDQRLALPDPPSDAVAPGSRLLSDFAVSLSWLDSFASSLPAPDLTAAEVAAQQLAPATRGGSYAELLLDSGSANAVALGRPYHYVVHAPSRPLAETVSSLRQHFAAEAKRHRPARSEAGEAVEGEEVFVWVDMFAVGAGGVGALGPAELRRVAAGAASVVAVLDEGGAALRLPACLYGIWLAGQAGGDSGRRLHWLSYDLDFEVLRQAIVDLDLAAAPPSLEPERHMLAELLAAHGGAAPAAAAALREALVAAALADAGTEGGAAAAEDVIHLDRAARLLEALGREAEAEALLRRVLAASEAGAGRDHPDTLTAAANLGSHLADAGRGEAAEPLLRRVMEGYERAAAAAAAGGGGGHGGVSASGGAAHDPAVDAAAAADALAGLVGGLGRAEEAEALLRRALAGYEAALGAEHREALAAANSLAQALKARGNFEEAEALFARALAGYEAALGPAHHDTLGCVNNLALLLKAAGKLEEAEPLYRRALAGCESGLGPGHPDTLSAVNNLAALLQAQGHLAEAEPLFRRALAGREAALGAEHPDTLGSENNLAVLLQAQEKNEEAEPLFRRALAGWESCLGPDHPDTLTAARNLALILEVLGRHAEALALYTREAEGRARRGDAARAELRQEDIQRLQGLLKA